MLRVDPGEFDPERFESLAERGRTDGDGKLLREALALWRGEPLAELRDEPFARRGPAARGSEAGRARGPNQVTRVDTRTRRPDVVVPVRNRAFLLGVGAGSLWVTEHPSNLGDNGTVARIDLKTAQLLHTYRVGAFPIDVKVGLGAAWATNGGDVHSGTQSLVR